MFFTNFSIVVLGLIASVSAAPLGRARRDTAGAKVAKNAATATSSSVVTATVSATETVMASATPTFVTIISAIKPDGPAITLASTGSTTLFGTATYTVAPPMQTHSTDEDDAQEDASKGITSQATDVPDSRRRWVPRGGKQARDIVAGKNKSTPKTEKKNSTGPVVTIISQVNGPAITLASSAAQGTATTVFGSSTYTVLTATPTATGTATEVKPTATTTANDETSESSSTTPSSTESAAASSETSAAPSDVSEERRRVYIPRGGNAARDVVRTAKRKNAASSSVSIVGPVLTIATGSLVGALFLL